ncbi:MAG: site-2 protease family protein [Patescibacteria group bacterium]
MDIIQLFYIVILIFSVIVHEVAHGYAADYLGDPTARLQGRLTLNPVPHIDMLGSIILPALLIFSQAGFVIGWAKPVPYNPYNLKNQRSGTFIVAIAGVFTNFLIALFFGLLVRFSGELGIGSQAFLEIASMVIFVNVLLGVFNLIPIPPLDGSKVLFSLLSPTLYYIEEFLSRYSIILLILLIFFLWRLVLPLVYFLFALFSGVSLGILNI